MAISLPLFPMVSIQRRECEKWEGCELTACRHHLGYRPEDDREPCSLKWAEAGPLSPVLIGELLGLSDEQIRNIEEIAIRKITPILRRRGLK